MYYAALFRAGLSGKLIWGIVLLGVESTGVLMMKKREHKRVSSSPNSFTSHLSKSFIATYGPLLAFFGVLLTVISYYVIPDDNSVPTRYVIVALLLAAYSIAGLAYASWSAFNRKSTMPSVVTATEAPRSLQQSVAILVLEASDLFPPDCLVSVYSVEDDIETLVAIGRVFTIQEDRKIQVLVTHMVGEADWKSILQNNINELQRLRVKPTIPAIAFMEAVHRIGDEISSVGLLLDVLGSQVMASSELAQKWGDKLPVMQGSINEAKRMLTSRPRPASHIEPQFELTNIGSLIERSLSRVLPPGAARIQEPSLMRTDVMVDPGLMEQVFRELGTNAFHCAGETVEVLIGSSRENDSLSIFFQDNGPGIPSEHADRVFEPFVSLKGFGTGLGLATVRHIVESHFGTVRLVESDVGAKFVIRIPLTGDMK